VDSGAALARKCEAYRAYWATGTEQEHRGAFPQIVFLVPSERRRAFVIDLLTAQPAESWKLFHVGLSADGAEAFRSGRGES